MVPPGVSDSHGSEKLNKALQAESAIDLQVDSTILVKAFKRAIIVTHCFVQPSVDRFSAMRPVSLARDQPPIHTTTIAPHR